MQGHVWPNPLWDLAQREGRKSGFREGSQPKTVPELHVLHLLVRVDGMLRIPTMKGIDWFTWIGRHLSGKVWKSPSIWVAHHNVHEVHAHVEQVILLAPQLKPNRAVHILHMESLKLLPGLLVSKIKVAQNTRIASDLEGLVDNIIEAWPKHLLPLGPSVSSLLQCEAHMAGLNARSHTEICGASPKVSLVRHLLLPTDTDILADEVHQRLNLSKILVVQATCCLVLPDKVPLRPSSCIRRRRRAPRVCDHATCNVHLVGIEFSLNLQTSLHDIIFWRGWLLWRKVWHRGHFSQQPGLGNLISSLQGWLRLNGRVLRDAGID
mmetsp:Transcript_30389/g.48691  ORF Transcript_30389/g.48691 Transcript_30389/m.48691 type:complete len:322 (+) Transcript_30389:4237-5202(+)